MTEIEARIEVSGVRKRFGSTVALGGMTFTVPPGQVTGFVGPNGAGKSTTMRVILGLDAPDAGTALIGGRARRGSQPPAGEAVNLTTVSNPTELMPDSDLRVEEDVRIDTSHGDHDRFAHYVDKNEMMESHVFGTPIKALCGKVWVPSRDAKRYPVCPECKEIYESLPDGDDDGAE